MWTFLQKTSCLCLSIKSKGVTSDLEQLKSCCCVTTVVCTLCYIFRAHWFLVVVCFPGLEDVQFEEFHRPAGRKKRSSTGLLM